MDYPFEPESNRYLQPGQYWPVSLSDGRFACGRVLAVPTDPDPFIPVSTRLFFAGLLDWVGREAPSDRNIAGAALLRQGFAHIKTISATGGPIVGIRPLDLDGVEPYLWRSHSGGPGVWVYRGAHPVREAQRADASLPVMSTWGFRVLSVVAEATFVHGREIAP